MALEIERKWLLKSLPDKLLEGIAPIEILQGYIAVHEDKTEVRVRKFGNEYWQTIKSPGHISRQEFEIPITETLFWQLFELTKGRNLRKNRYLYPYHNHIMEIDEYLGQLSGLVVCEIEFGSLEEANSFDPPDWFLEDISGHPQYKNFTLASKPYA